jgi:hypothetical protein
MKYTQTFKDFLNEAKTIKVDLTPELFSETSTWGIYKNEKMTGNNTYQWNSNLLADTDAEVDRSEQNVVLIQVVVNADGKSYAKVGITNSLKKEPTTTYGTNYTFDSNDAKKNLKKISSEAATFLMDGEHFKWINKNIKSDKRNLSVTPKGDFTEVFSKVIEAAIKN